MIKQKHAFDPYFPLPYNWAGQVRIDTISQQAKEWCESIMQPSDFKVVYYSHGNALFQIKSNDDFMMFKLRWS